MKKNWCLQFFLTVGVCFLTGCAPSNHLKKEKKAVTFNVVSTTAMIDDLVNRIGQERIHHQVLIQGEIDPHSYEIVKGDDEKIVGASLVFYNGLGLEHGASLRYLLKNHPCAIALGEKVKDLVPNEMILLEGKIDPHIWLDVSLWEKTIPFIVHALTERDPEGRAFFEANAHVLSEELKKTHAKIYTTLQSTPSNQRFLVTSHDAFTYFTRAYLATPEERKEGTWLKRFASPEGLAPEGQLSSADIQHIVDHILCFQIHTIFPESNVSSASLRKIASVCKAKKFDVVLGKVLYGDAMGKKGSLAGTYEGMMQSNADVLCEAWKP